MRDLQCHSLMLKTHIDIEDHTIVISSGKQKGEWDE